jgi:hypothetical protein
MAVNKQTGVTKYTTAQGDSGALITFRSPAPVAVTLNNSVTLPWYCVIANYGSGVVTLAPESGTFTGISRSIPSRYAQTVYFDGSDWFGVAFPVPSDSGSAPPAGSFLPGTTATLTDDALEDFIQSWLVGVTGLAGQLVRPAWQADPTPIPEAGTTWLAFAARVGKSDWDSVSSYVGGTEGGFGEGDFGIDPFGEGEAIPGAQLQTKFEELDVTCSFYGPLAGGSAMALRMGAGVGQNLWVLASQAMAFVSVGDALTLSEKIKGKFVRRIDVELVLRRTVQFSYAVQSVTSAKLGLNADSLFVPLSVDGVAATAQDIAIDPNNPAA